MANALSKHIAAGLGWTRDTLARRLVRAGVTPNHLTLVGLLFTLLAAVFIALAIARSRSDTTPLGNPPGDCMLWFAAVWMILAGAMDILDGAVARVGSLASAAGAFLDSTLDRLGDVALFAAMVAGFAWQGNFTYVLLASMAMGHAVLISYTRARAEDIIANCKVGYWERGERIAAILIACLFYQVPAVLWQLATLPMLTAIRRVLYTLHVLDHRRRSGHDLSETHVKPIGQGLYKLALWRYPRMTLPYDVVTATNILWIIFAPISGASDPLRRAIELLAR